MPVVRWFQRRIRGWDDRDTWDLDNTMAALLLPRFRRFRKLKENKGVSSVFFPAGYGYNESELEQEKNLELARQRQAEVYDDIEYFLNAIVEGDCSDGLLFTDEIERHLTVESTEEDRKPWSFPIHRQIRDERWFRGRRYLIRYWNTLWW